MARQATARNKWIGDYMRGKGTANLSDANAAYARAHGSRASAPATTAPTPIREGVGDLFGPRENPGGGIGTGTLLLAGVVAYVAVPSVRDAVNGAIKSLTGTVQTL